ncbi:YDG domain-containing protein, partial [Agitococcus lubricus]
MSRHASLNRAYRLVWDEIRQLWIPVAECVRCRGKRGRVLTLASSLLLSANSVLALPTGGQITAGEGVILPDTQQMTIAQQTEKLAIDWQGFNIAANETVSFIQPSTQSIALNRVTTQDPSQILGGLQANGQVFVLNPNGVLFAPSAQVSVGGLVASTLHLSNADFLTGHYQFTGLSQATVNNQGQILTPQGGYVALMAAQVRNEGHIIAPQGSVQLAAANAVTVQLANGSLVGLHVEKGSLDALAENRGVIQANGGQIFLTADAVDHLAKAVVNNEGVLEAQTVENHQGEIRLLADMSVGTVKVAGQLDASAATGDGGFIETSGAYIDIADEVSVSTQATQGKTGTWLIDPTDFTIASSGGDVTGATLSAALEKTDIIIQNSLGKTAGNGDIHVDDDVSWGANTQLELMADRNININANITATGTSAGLILTTGTDGNYTLKSGTAISLTGTSALLKINGNLYTLIYNADDLQNIAKNLTGFYALAQSIDASSTSTWNRGLGFNPIGSDVAFTGILDGLGHTVSGLTIDRPSNNQIGLFAQSAGSIQHLTLTKANITGASHVGLLSATNTGKINQTTVDGTLTLVTDDVNFDLLNVGGLVGYNQGHISDSQSAIVLHANAPSVTSYFTSVGGLVGNNAGTVSQSSATGSLNITLTKGGNVSGVGGLVGFNNALITQSTSTVNVSVLGQQMSVYSVGGLVGENRGAGNDTIGGGAAFAAAAATDAGEIVDSMASGDVSITGVDAYSMNAIGGLVGLNTGILNLQGINTNTTNGAVSVATSEKSSTSGSFVFNVGGMVGENRYKIYTLNNAIYSASVTVDNRTTNGFISNVGGITGSNASLGQLTNVYGSVSVFGDSLLGGFISSIGGVAGSNSGSIQQADATVSLNDANGVLANASYIGGVVGYNNGKVTQSASTGWIQGSNYVGGLVGYNTAAGTISESYSYAFVQHSDNSNSNPAIVGGLVGQNDGVISLSYFAGAVEGADSGNSNVATGGLVGLNNSSAKIANTYAEGTVTGGQRVGGLVGHSYGLVENSYARNEVVGFDLVGGLIGLEDSGSSVVGSFYDLSLTDNGSAYGMAKADFFNASTFEKAGWQIASKGGSADIWRIYEGETAPLLRNFLTRIVVTANNQQQTYDGSQFSGGNGVNYSITDPSSDLLLGTVSYGGSAQGARNAGVYRIDAGGFYSSQQGYDIEYQAGQLTIDPKTLTVANSIAFDKVYDGNVTASITAELLDVIKGDDISLSHTAVFADKHVGADKNISVNYVLTGNDQTNYVLAANTDTLHAAITPKALIVKGSSAVDKVYDANTQAQINLGSVNGVIVGDDISLSATGTFDSKQVGTGKAVAADYRLDGTDSLNYDVVDETLFADITVKTISGTVTADNKVYDGKTNATVSGSLLDVIAGDDVQLSSTGQFSDKHVGNDKLVTLTNSLSGNDLGNYSIQLNDTATADITVKTISRTVTAENKVYDGKTNATVSGSLLDVIVGDDVQLSSTGQFATKDVGSNKTVTLTNQLSGADLNNYSIQLNDTATADITVKTISGTVTADNKVYDGKTNATVSGSLLDVIAGDDVQLSSTGQFSDKHVGNDKLVTLTNSLSGNDLGNYSIQLNDTATADITVKTISGTVTAENKVYDGKTNATVSGSLLDVIAGDDVQLSSTGQFSDKQVGQGKTVTLSNSISGIDAQNYSIQLNDTATADITVKTISGTVTAENKVYDGKTNATVSGSLLDVIAGDEVLLSSTGQFATKDVGSNKIVTLSNTISGIDAQNYSIQLNDTATADITVKTISGTVTAENKVYDGKTNATVSSSLLDVIAGDDVQLSSTGQFSDKHVGNDKLVTLTNSLSGNDLGNYSIQLNDTATADITVKTISGTVTADNKVYDGKTNATVSGSLLDVIAGDDVQLSSTGQFSD